MAGMDTIATHTYYVKDASGVVPDTFVMGIADTAGLNLNIKNVTGANVKCVGIAGETKANTKACSVYDTPGNISRVIGDGTCAVGDWVTNDASGYATPIAATGTPTLYYVHGEVVRRDKSGSGQLVDIRQMKSTIYV